MQYTVAKTQQTIIEAPTAEEAVKKVLNGEGISSGASFTANVRPPQQQVAGVPSQPQVSRPNG